MLIETAFRLFAEKGYQQTSTEDIVKEARVSKGLLFYHFKNKEGLLDAIIAEAMGDIRRISRVSAPNSEPMEVFTQLIRQYLQSFRDHHAFWRLYGELMLYAETREKILDGGMHKFFSSYYQLLRGLFHQLGLEDVESALRTFDTVSQGILWRTLTHPDTYPLEEMESTLRDCCLIQLYQ